MSPSPELLTASTRIVESLDLEESRGWNEEVSDVLVILSASRSGSSVIFNALAESPNIIAPAGEHEPWLLLSGNKYPFTQSDELKEINNPELLLKLLQNDLLVRADEVDTEEYLTVTTNRLRLRGQSLPISIVEEVSTSDTIDTVVHQHLVRTHYRRIPQHKPPNNPHELEDGDHIYPFENPPYIEHVLARRATMDELAAKTLLFKSPSDAYRAGMYEELFPNATVRYIHLTRGYAQTINGIMDGWQAGDRAFISNGVGLFDAGLDIAGYSHDGEPSVYWCFDLFPGWERFTDADLITIAAMQWLKAHKAIIDQFNPRERIQFEDLHGDRERFTKRLEGLSGCEIGPNLWDIPIMATHAPRPQRWKNREALFSRLGKLLDKDIHDQLINTNALLGYSEDISTWL